MRNSCRAWKTTVRCKDEFAAGARALEARLAKLDFTRMLSGPYDRYGAILTIQPGAGGVESMDWAQMLVRMYTRWAERRGFKLELLDLQPGEEAGIKNATFKVNGDWAFGLLRSEKGVHRLVRVSPFDSAGRRHTSFASVEAVPQLEEDADIVIDDKELRIDVYRSSGAGGQHVNRTESAVRITHLPTGLVTQCQNDRSQLKNRESAMSVLKSRLFVMRQEEQKAKLEGIAGAKSEINFGSQIRSYVLFPYQLVKDVRTDVETSQTQAVLDGDIDQFIEGVLEAGFGGSCPCLSATTTRSWGSARWPRWRTSRPTICRRCTRSIPTATPGMRTRPPTAPSRWSTPTAPLATRQARKLYDFKTLNPLLFEGETAGVKMLKSKEKKEAEQPASPRGSVFCAPRTSPRPWRPSRPP